MTNIAISYARFSSAKQAAGDSLRRQVEETEKYVAAHDLVLDRSLSFTDIAVSAYDKSNIKTGALGVFLKAIEQDRVPIGATLIVESLDRLSRATVLDALEVFIAILNAGLNIVTLVDKQRYSREVVQGNVGMLMMSLGVMQRAHDESATKSDRINKLWEQKKKDLRATRKVLSRKVPHWLTVNADRTEIKPDDERAKVVMNIIELAEKGVGNHTLGKQLNATVPAWSKSGKWEPSYIQKTLSSPALFGAIDLDGEIIDGYYPALITRERYDVLQSLRSARATTKNYNRKGKEVTNLFSGLMKCGYCGSSMNICGYRSRVSGYARKYAGCHGARIGATDCQMRVWFIDELEPALLFWMTQIDFNKLLGTSKKSELDAARELLVSIEVEIPRLELSIVNGNIAIEQGVLSMIDRVKDHELKLRQERVRLEEQQRKVHALTTREGGGATRMKTIVLLFKALKHTADELQIRALREQLSSAIQQVVERIDLYPTGQTKSGTKEDRYAVITFRNGAVRTIEPGET